MRKGLRRLLRQVVTDAARDGPVLVFAGEFLGVRTGLRVRCAIGVAFECDGRHCDDRRLRKPLFQIVVFRLTLREAEPPAVIMDDDCNVIRVVERCGATIEGGIVEIPFGRSKLPNELRKIVTVFVVAFSAAVGGEVKLVPPLQLGPASSGLFATSREISVCTRLRGGAERTRTSNQTIISR